jgi:hypothetical protein
MPRGERSTTDPFSTLRTPEIISEPGLPLVSGKFAPMAQLFIAGRGSQARTSCRSGPNSFRSDKRRQADRQSLGTEVAISTPDTIKPGQDVVASYRYLGLAMVILVAVLAVSILFEPLQATCLQGSISAYHSTPTHSIFMAAAAAVVLTTKGSE